MFENIMKIFKKTNKKEDKKLASSKEAAKERLHLVLMQDRANVSADFLELMKQEIIDVIKKYIDVDESAIDVRLTNKENEDGTNGAPALYANIPIVNIKNSAKKAEATDTKKDEIKENKEKVKEEDIKENAEEIKKDSIEEKIEKGDIEENTENEKEIEEEQQKELQEDTVFEETESKEQSTKAEEEEKEKAKVEKPKTKAKKKKEKE